MITSSTAYSFPPGTRFFSLDGTLFAHAGGDEWFTINANGALVKLDAINSRGNGPGLVFTGDRIRQREFLAALGEGSREIESRQFQEN